MPKSLLAAILALGCLGAHATEAVTTERSPGDLTEDERVAMMRIAHDYNRCVYDAAIAGIDADPDIRRIADQAMGACEDHLGKLGETITGWGFPGGFAEGFTRTVRDRAVRQLLPELAVRKGS